MTLPIIDSMLRGDLRRQILNTLKTEKEISLLWRELMKSFNKGNYSLNSIEESLIVAVEESGLVHISEDYKYDRELREGAENARKQGVCLDEDNYTKVEKVYSLDGLFDSSYETTPTDKYLHLLIKVECQRTVQSLISLVESVHDDAVVRTNIRKLFSTISSLCKDANDLYIKESLTQLYFEVYHTFRLLLEKSSFQSYETDFENFIFEWKGEFPDEEVVERYNELINARANEALETPNLPQLEEKESKVPTGAEAVENEIITKYDHFVEVVSTYKFFECPAVACLTSNQRGELVRLIVSRFDNYGAYAVAMLCELNYDKWMMENFAKANPYSKKGLTKGTVFKHWLDALSLSNERAIAGNYNVIRKPDGKENRLFYKAAEYTKIVHEDYMNIKLKKEK